MWKYLSLLLLACGLASGAHAQQSSTLNLGSYNLNTAVQALRTEAEKEAVGFVFDFFKDRQFFYSDITTCAQTGRYDPNQTHGWLFDLSPDIRVNTGTEDAFQSIVAKISGNFIAFSLRPPRPGGVDFPTPDPDALINVFPLSAGVETTADGDTVNVIGELGYVPFKFSGLPAIGSKPIQLGVNPFIGFFVQGGQKVRQEAEFETGGARDDSGENEGKGIGLLKSAASLELIFPMRVLGQETGLSVRPSATGWYEFLHDEFYYTLELSVGIILIEAGEDRRTLWEFTVQDGSGEPNFTEGTQFGTGLKVVY